MVEDNKQNDSGAGGTETNCRPAGDTGATEKGAGADHSIPQADGDDGTTDNTNEDEQVSDR